MSNTTTKPLAERHVTPIAMLVMMTIATAAVSFCMFKFPPIMRYVMMQYNVDTGLVGVLMSSTNIVGFVFAVAIGHLNRKTPPKWTGFAGFLIMALANVVAMNSSSFAVLIASRVVEGAGMGILSNLTLALVVTYFKGARATATAIVNAGMTIGEVIHFNLSARLADASGNLRSTYMYIIVTFVALAVAMICFLWKEPALVDSTPVEHRPDQNELKAKKAEVLSNKTLWMIAVAMFIFNFVMISFSNYVPTFLEQVKGMDPVQASTWTSVASSLRTVVMIVVGILADRMASKRKPAIGAFAGITIMYLALALVPGNFIIIYIVLNAVAPAPVTVSTYSCYPDIFEDASYTPVAHGVVQTLARLSMLIGSTVVGFMIQGLGMLGTVYVLIPLSLVGMVMWILAKKVK